MKIKTITVIKIMIFALISSILLPGCGQSTQKPSGQQQSLQLGQQSGKMPDQLKEIEDGIEKIIAALDGPSAGAEESAEKGAPKNGQGSQSSQGGQSSSGQGGSQGGQGGQGSQGSGGQGGQGSSGQQAQASPQPAQQQSQQDPWEKIAPVINTLHYQWNSLVPSAVKQGASRALIDNFSNALNSLTSTSIGKNKTNTLMAASYLYAYVPDFYSLYSTKTSPEIKRVRYYIRNAVLNSMTSNWVQAESDINSLKASWLMLKSTLSKDQQDNSSKLDFSISELEKVVKEKNQPLIDIKGRVALFNVESMEKSMEKASGQTNQGGQGQ